MIKKNTLFYCIGIFIGTLFGGIILITLLSGEKLNDITFCLLYNSSFLSVIIFLLYENGKN